MNNKDFLEQLILKVNPDLDDAGLEMMVSDAEPVLEEWVFTNIISTLNESQRAELIKITDNKEYKSWKAYEFLSTVIPHYEDFIKKVYEDFEKMYKENVKAFSK